MKCFLLTAGSKYFFTNPAAYSCYGKVLYCSKIIFFKIFWCLEIICRYNAKNNNTFCSHDMFSIHFVRLNDCCVNAFIVLILSFEHGFLVKLCFKRCLNFKKCLLHIQERRVIMFLFSLPAIMAASPWTLG